jgi:hypothetical protein
MSQLFEHGLARHLGAPEFTPGGQRVLVGTKSMGDGWVAAIIRLEGCANHDETAWIGARIQADVVDYIGVMNDEDVPLEAVAIECGLVPGVAGWSVAVYVTLASAQEAGAMFDFLTAYALPSQEMSV